MPKLSYVTVCVNYLDFLALSYKHNKDQFDEYCVVTSPADKATQQFCADNGIICTVTDAFYWGGAVFNKGLAINAGFAALLGQATKPEWVCFMDADTFVNPGQPREFLHLLDQEWFYGAERILLPTYEDYLAAMQEPTKTARFKSPRGCGFGFFQLFHWDSEVIRNCQPGLWYPSYPDATCSDWMFRNKWGDYAPGSEYTVCVGQFARLPFKVWNLGKDGENHFGRVSSVFTSPVQQG